MKTGLLAPLSPQEEVTLRRVAHGSVALDASVVSKLLRLALIERTRSGLRLTPLGQLRYAALPKAPLLGRPRSIHVASGYVEGIIEKAQQRAQVEPVRGAIDRDAPTDAASGPPIEDESEPQEIPLPSLPMVVLFDQQHFRKRACASIERVRRMMKVHQAIQDDVRASSLLQISRSRSLLAQSVPVRPAWLKALR
jgi:hypothetical protein